MVQEKVESVNECYGLKFDPSSCFLNLPPSQLCLDNPVLLFMALGLPVQ